MDYIYTYGNMYIKDVDGKLKQFTPIVLSNNINLYDTSPNRFFYANNAAYVIDNLNYVFSDLINYGDIVTVDSMPTDISAAQVKPESLLIYEVEELEES